MSENQKQEILEKQRKTYAMRRIGVGVATNNEHRAGQVMLESIGQNRVVGIITTEAAECEAMQQKKMEWKTSTKR